MKMYVEVRQQKQQAVLHDQQNTIYRFISSAYWIWQNKSSLSLLRKILIYCIFCHPLRWLYTPIGSIIIQIHDCPLLVCKVHEAAARGSSSVHVSISRIKHRNVSVWKARGLLAVNSDVQEKVHAGTDNVRVLSTYRYFSLSGPTHKHVFTCLLSVTCLPLNPNFPVPINPRSAAQTPTCTLCDTLESMFTVR